LFDPSSGAFTCEDDKTELLDHDPAAHSVGGQEKMQAFNIATQPIRDSLKRLEGLTLPSLNIMAWIAQNVVTEVVGVDSTDGEKKKVQVVIGGEEKDMLEKERLQEAQRYVYSIGAELTIVSKTRYHSGIRTLQSLAPLPPLVLPIKLVKRLSKHTATSSAIKPKMGIMMICSKLIMPVYKVRRKKVTSSQPQSVRRRVQHHLPTRWPAPQLQESLSWVGNCDCDRA
jgi:hypothetical protein